MKIQDVPCLLSPSANPARKTPFTVEALSLSDDTRKRNTTDCSVDHRRWVGINQNRANDYVASFLESGALNDVLSLPSHHQHQERTLRANTVQREVSIRDVGPVLSTLTGRGRKKNDKISSLSKRTKQTRLDFLVNGNHYIEVKTPVGEIGLSDDESNNVGADMSPKALEVWGERLIRHFNTVADLVERPSARKASVLLCFMYDAPRFHRTETRDASNPIVKAVMHAQRCGVTFWQVNLAISNDGVELIRTMPLQ